MLANRSQMVFFDHLTACSQKTVHKLTNQDLFAYGLQSLFRKEWALY